MPGFASNSPLRLCAVVSLGLLAASSGLAAQQGAATGDPLVVRVSALPKGFVRQPYRFALEADGGITPVHWLLMSGSLPPGLSLEDDGTIAGVPTKAGSFRLNVTLVDSGRPPQKKNQELTIEIAVPMVVKWGREPKVNGQRIEGTITVSNQTNDDFDLTMIVLAVNDIGRATAIGYQHFVLPRQTLDFELPFGENLPHGAYQINCDVVSEVAATNTIYRARLVANQMQVTQGP
jgi:hypothetical protein